MRRSEPEGARRGRVIRQLADAVETLSRAGRFEEASHATEVLADAVEEYGQHGLAEVLRTMAPPELLASDFWSIHVVPDALRRARHLADELIEKGGVEVLDADRHGWGIAPSHVVTPFHPVLTRAGYRYMASSQQRVFPTGHGIMAGPTSFLVLRHRYALAGGGSVHEIVVSDNRWDARTARRRCGSPGGPDAQSLGRYLVGRARRRR